MTELQFLRALFDGMRCGILCVDARGRLLVTNDQATQILELDPLPDAGVPLDRALARHPRLVQMLVDSFAMSLLPSREELQLGDDDRPGKTIGYTLSQVKPHGESEAGVAMFFRDLTLIEQREEQERLKDRLAALGGMAASLAHEIRNPLASIKVTCSLLRRRLGPPENRALLDKIVAEVNRLNGTITSSLEFVRPVSLDLAEANVVRLLEEAIEVANGRYGAGSTQIRTEFEADLPPIEIDRGQVRQVFENLLLNAVEAVGEGGVVDVVARCVRPAAAQALEACGVTPHPLVEIRVADNGPGIAEEDTDKVFYPFYTTKEQGSGVGLSMAKKIVDCHHGQIDVVSGDNGGAVFVVRLPITQA
jgi:signal transduction histidine kinase